MDSNSDSPPGPLQQLYFAVEDVYYDVVEFLDGKLGIPVIKYFVEPIESRGMPSFPFAVLLSLFFLFALFASFSALSVPSSVDLSVRVFSGQSPVKLANISLSFDGKESLQFTGSDGKATFRNLPYGKSVVVNASKPGLQSADKKIKLEQARQSLSISLEPVSLRPQGVNQITIKVFDSRQVPLGGVKIEYYSVAGVLLGTKFTDATGIAEIGFDGENQVLSIDVSKQGFAPKERQMVFFSHKIPYEIQLDALNEKEDETKTAELIVQVKNSQGAPVDSFVTIHSQSTDEEVSSGRAGSSGQASFEIEFGSKLYAIATPATQEGKAKYATSFGDKNPFTLNKDPFILSVVLAEKNSSFGTIALEIQDAATSAAVNGAKVTLYDAYLKKFLQEALSSGEGEASFDVVNTSLYFATIYATGFLPTSVSSLKAGDFKTVKLYEANSSNSGFVRATVSSFDGEKEKDATVKLLRDFDSLPLGIPSKKTNTTGYAFFEQVPSLAALRAVAEKGARNGESDSFTVAANQTSSVSIVLSQGSGNVTVAIVDDVFKTRISGKVRALAENQSELASCDTAPLPCTMVLPAGVKFQLAAISANHEPSGIPGTLETVLAVEEARGTQENPLEVSLVPSEFKNQLYASFQGAFEESNPTVQVSSVDRDKNYFAKLNVHFPSNMTNSRGGFYFRLGEDGSAQETDFVITDFEFPQGASINRKSEANTQNLCVGDEDVSSCLLSQGGGCKSVKAEYPVGMPVGMNVFKVHFFVRPESVSQEREANVSLRFRVYANSNGTFVRSPSDNQLADNVDFCTANTSQEILPLFAGTTCDETACISVKFKNSTGEYAPGFTTMLGKSFDAIIRVRQRENLFGNVQLRVSASPHFNFSTYSFENAGGRFVVENKEILATRQTSAEFGVNTNTTALHTTGFSKGFLHLKISSDNYEKELFPRINVAGTNPLRVSLNPAQIFVGEKATVTATLTNFFAGVPIQDAYLGAFYSYNPTLQVASNQSLGTHIYLLNISASPPTKLGNLSVKALAGPDSGEAKINITNREFIDVNATRLAPCNENRSFKITNNGQYNAITQQLVVSAPSNCVSYLKSGTESTDQSGSQTLTFASLEPNASKTILVVPPTPSSTPTSCNVSISTTINTTYGVFSSSKNVEYYHCTTPPEPSAPRCILSTNLTNPDNAGTTPLPVNFSAEFLNFPQSPAKAKMSCGGTTGELERDVNNQNKSWRECNYPQEGSFTANASVTLQGGTVVKCEKTVSTTTGPIIPPAPEVKFNPLVITFVIGADDKVVALNKTITLNASPIIPSAGALIMIINNRSKVAATSIRLNADPSNCLDAFSWAGNRIDRTFDIAEYKNASFALVFGQKTYDCPNYSISNDRLNIDNYWLSKPSELTVGFGTSNDSSHISLYRKVLSSGDFALARFPKQGGLLAANNIQTPRMSLTLDGGATISPAAYASVSILPSFVLFPQSNAESFTTTRSPILPAVSVRSDLGAAYAEFLNQLPNNSVALPVFGVKPNADYYAPISDTANGGTGVTVMHRFSVRDYALVAYPDGERRCNYNTATGKCEEPCGGKGQTPCEGACFADAITEGVRDKNTRDYNGICNCGLIGQNACTRDADPAQQYECSNTGAAKGSDGKCVVCGWPGLPACDQSRGVTSCLMGGAASGGICPQAGAGGGGSECPTAPPAYCTLGCGLVDGAVKPGCNLLDLQNEAKQEASNSFSAIFSDLAYGVNGGDDKRLQTEFNTCANGDYACIKQLADSGGNIEYTETVFGYYTEYEGRSVFRLYNPPEVNPTAMPAADYLQQLLNNDLTIEALDDNCASGVVEGGVCMQKIGEVMEGDAKYCASGQKNEANLCCQVADHSSSDPALCCSKNYKGTCDGAGGDCSSDGDCSSHSACSGSQVSGSDKRVCSCLNLDEHKCA